MRDRRRVPRTVKSGGWLGGDQRERRIRDKMNLQRDMAVGRVDWLQVAYRHVGHCSTLVRHVV